MEQNAKRIGILTSGGDAPGMNAVIRAIVRTATARDVSVLGIRRGYSGLISGDIVELTRRSVDRLLPQGGTYLYTARCEEMLTEAGQEKAVQTCRHMGIEGLAVIGGDGSFQGALTLAKKGLATVGIPATIDNDIACTDYSIGFDTACNTAVDAIDKLRDTMQSHERCSVVEVMGRSAGHLALHVGVAVGATCILLPEQAVDFTSSVIEPIRMGRLKGRHHHIILVAEGYGNAQDVAEKVQETTGMDARVTILGHIQRGGTPSAMDRVFGTQMGCHATGLLLTGERNRLVIKKDGNVVDCDMEEGLSQKKCLEQSLFEAALAVTS